MPLSSLQVSLSDFLQIGSGAVILSAIGYGVFRGVYDVIHRKALKREEYFKSFDAVTSQLSSSNTTSQLAAAVLLRRYFDMKQMQQDDNLRGETINVISAMLRVLPVGVFQKTLGDGLPYARELSGADLQRVNLQNVYLGVKDSRKPIQMRMADLFTADLSYALLENIQGPSAIFYDAILFNARIKNCDFSNANFKGADLKGACFSNVLLKGADFTGATNVPREIAQLLEKGVVKSESHITTSRQENRGQVFFSMPGCLGKREEALTKEYKRILEARGFPVIYYQRDNYPEYGQFTKIRESITKSAAVIAFGFRQVNIEAGVSLPDTPSESRIDGKWLHTPWNEIEVGMALMRGLPILLVKDNGIDSGIFDEKLSECFIATIPVDYDCRNIETNNDFGRWLSNIR